MSRFESVVKKTSKAITTRCEKCEFQCHNDGVLIQVSE